MIPLLYSSQPGHYTDYAIVAPWKRYINKIKTGSLSLHHKLHDVQLLLILRNSLIMFVSESYLDTIAWHSLDVLSD